MITIIVLLSLRLLLLLLSKCLIIDLLQALVKETDNDLDDAASIGTENRTEGMTKKATEDSSMNCIIFVTELLDRIKSGEATTQDLKAAIEWLAQE